MSIYREEVLAKNHNFPDFQDSCFICGKMDCAVKWGLYSRKDGTLIQRWLCSSTLKEKNKHRTFSLLPWPLVPYHSYNAELYWDIFQKITQAGTHCEIANTYIPQKYSNIEIGSLLGSITPYKRLIESALLKWKTSTCHGSSLIKSIQNMDDLNEACKQYWKAEVDFLLGPPSQSRKQSCRPP